MHLQIKKYYKFNFQKYKDMLKIGILGGGQLGLLFVQNAINYPVEIHILDPNPEASCAKFAHGFVVGDFNNEQDVLDFAKDMDIIGIEIEHVNLEALKKLKKLGKTIIPDPVVLEIIQDKGLQKDFYFQHQIPTAELKNENDFPLVQKLRKGGYDGKGVQVLSQENKHKKWSEASVFEEIADIKLELAVIIARNFEGETAIYPVIEQVINKDYNLLEYLLMPARIDDETAEKAKKIALQVVDAFNQPGIYAIELFLNKNGEIWVNETAPRVHNSGHASIEASDSSQFDMMLRVLLNLPLGSTKLKSVAGILNIIGEENHQGPAKVLGLKELMKIPGAAMHWYGKKITKPGRKMGHATFCADTHQEVIEQIEKIKSELKSIA